MLRYGASYGPGTWDTADDLVPGRIVEGTLAATPAVTSFLHVAPGLAWVPAIARELGLPSPAVQHESAP